MPKFILIQLISFLCALPLIADNRPPNGDFELGLNNWNLFVPEDAKESGCKMESIEGAGRKGSRAIRMTSGTPARFAVVSRGIPCQPGQHYRIRAWVRAKATATVQAGTPGVMMRMTFAPDGNVDVGPLHVLGGLAGKASSGGNVKALAVDVLPTEWTQIEFVAKVPEGVKYFMVALFGHKTTGEIYWDDVAVDEVSVNTPVTPLH